jgi:hypothetical protein
MTNRFLAFTKKYGWLILQNDLNGAGAFWTFPVKYRISEQDVLQRVDLPPMSVTS